MLWHSPISHPLKKTPERFANFIGSRYNKTIKPILMLTLAIVEDHHDYAFALADHLQAQPDFLVLATYHSAADALQGICESPVDIAIIDVGLNAGESIGLIRQLKISGSPARCLVLTMLRDDRTLFNALRAGADGYVLKDAGLEKITEALHELANGGAPMSPFISKKILEAHYRRSAANDRLLKLLSKREQEILEHAAGGLLNKEIGARMGIDRNTVKKHLDKIFDKLQVQNRMEAVKKFYSL
jgi:two-component system, NarL family, response regulator LiaR